VKRCVDADCICQWNVYGRGFVEFNMGVIIRGIKLLDGASRMEIGVAKRRMVTGRE
jgi:hypothetical protein